MGFESMESSQEAGNRAYVEGIENFADRVARAEQTLNELAERVKSDPTILERPGMRSIIETAERILEEAGEEPVSKLIH